MTGNGPSIKDLANMINNVMGYKVLTEQQMEQIMQGAKRANDRGGMGAVLDYLMKVTQADVDKSELKQFAEQVKANPRTGMDILQGKKRIQRRKK
ncbi:hypothetical protein ACFO25_09005 [Paenactinomyces guangxiensis]|uniref:Uncharacterized protein n=1 Tax=Paenactinomyces guangxiensis TaxID=1490290 RepID=A0A7W2A6R5_9BACL|nr:hypothetical protein [Paenactinomyces guangxiensis]MBA4492815.1 hypothetical protein [Paenactinomyces guangxiensis]MBH8590336.1 hypothetical protein [Paenactinomyces guangxiensis]